MPDALPTDRSHVPISVFVIISGMLSGFGQPAPSTATATCAYGISSSLILTSLPVNLHTAKAITYNLAEWTRKHKEMSRAIKTHPYSAKILTKSNMLDCVVYFHHPQWNWQSVITGKQQLLLYQHSLVMHICHILCKAKQPKDSGTYNQLLTNLRHPEYVPDYWENWINSYVVQLYLVLKCQYLFKLQVKMPGWLFLET